MFGFKETTAFPFRIWLSFVDDIFATFDLKKSIIHDFMTMSNNRFPPMIFRFEVGTQVRLPS